MSRIKWTCEKQGRRYKVWISLGILGEVEAGDGATKAEAFMLAAVYADGLAERSATFRDEMCSQAEATAVTRKRT